MIDTVLTPATAAALGITRHGIAHRIGTGRWQPLLPGVYLTHGGTPHPDERNAAALAFAGRGAVISGTVALRHHGVKASPARCSRTLVLVPPQTARTSSGFVHIRRTHLVPIRPVLIGGLAFAALPRAIVDACLGLRSRSTVRAIVAEAVQRQRCSLADLASELDRSARRGSLFLRAAVEEVGLGAWSAPECDAGDLLRRAGLPAFEHNVVVCDDEGRWLACGDVVWRRLRAILEVDSREHHADPDAWERTLARHNRLAAAGWAALHYPPRVISADPSGFVRQVRQWLTVRAVELGTSGPG
ncbi:MAG: hypothetical protein H0T66_10845 [Geodermatophilaceae bacterium]|nr:hypothetical protein [Geodermatophilaceae bacterium]MDQ3455301.1 hypothetical protein [Actinomycetota bacterium]